MESKEKRTWGGNNTHPNVCSKSNNNESKKLTHDKVIDRIAEQTVSVIIQVSKESKLRIHLNLKRPGFSFTYSFKFTYKCFARLAFHNSYKRY